MHPRDLATWLHQIEQGESENRLRAAMAAQAQQRG